MKGWRRGPGGRRSGPMVNPAGRRLLGTIRGFDQNRASSSTSDTGMPKRKWPSPLGPKVPP